MTTKHPTSFSLTAEVTEAISKWCEGNPFNRSDLAELMFREFFGLNGINFKFDSGKVKTQITETTTEIKTQTETKQQKWLNQVIAQLKRKNIYEREEFLKLQSGISHDILGEELIYEFLKDYALTQGVKLE